MCRFISKNNGINTCLSELKDYWDELPKSWFPYSLEEIPNIIEGGVKYLYMDDNIIDKDKFSLNRGSSKFVYGKNKMKQKLFNNVLGDCRYEILVNPWPRFKYQFLITTRYWQPQTLIEDNLELFERILNHEDYDGKIMLFFNAHKKVVNGFHTHLIFEKFFRYDQFYPTMTRIDHYYEHDILIDNNFENIKKRTLCYYQKYTNVINSSFHFFKKDGFFYVLIFHRPNTTVRGIEYHAHGVVTINPLVL